MAPRYLFGPVTAAFADQNLRRPCRAGACLAFDPSGEAGLRLGLADTWEDVCARLPAGWRPDFVVLDLHYTSVPPGLWSAPIPLVGLAADWHLLWHYYLRRLPSCDLVLTDKAGALALTRAGIRQVRAANLLGCASALVAEAPPEGPRDIDVLFAGSLHPAIQREQLASLGRLARLGERWRVVIEANAHGADYRRLLHRARVVFNPSTRGEDSRRAVEAAAAGALLFQEAGDLDVSSCFRDRQEHVAFHEDDLEALLEHYLSHEDERRALAAAGRERAGRLTFEELWEAQVEDIVRELPALAPRTPPRRGDDGEAELFARVWQMLGANVRDDRALPADLRAAVARSAHPAPLHNALGVLAAALRPLKEWAQAPAAEEALVHFRRAWEVDPGHVVAGLNLAEALACCGRRGEASAQARATLDRLDRLPPSSPGDAPRFPPLFDVFRVEWEGAGWAHAGRPDAEARARHALLRWRLHELLAGLTGDLVHAHEAALARPDLPATRAALGHALLRAGRPAEAVPHLRQAIDDNPFDRPAARALGSALGRLGRRQEQHALAHERRLLARAAPVAVPAEAWFTPADVVGPSAPVPADRFRIVWEGPQQVLFSFAQVNREFCRRLLARGHELSLLPEESADPLAPLSAAQRTLTPHFHRPLGGPADVYVSHGWPPRITPPPGRWVAFSAWEFGSLPRAWVEPLAHQAAEVWVYSHSVRQCHLDSGVPAERVHVIPLGVDPTLFHPDVKPAPLPARRKFTFLYVGGTIHRKGIDVLLDAYGEAFTARDDVCLVVKELGAGSFYRGQTAGDRIARLRATPGAPAVEYLEHTLSAEELAGLYAACDCLVHPYRGEGFGLPIVEAMACGLPVIVTRGGPALDYADESTAYLIPARKVHFRDRRVADRETVDHPWLLEPDRGALRDCLRRVVAHPEEARARGRAAAAHVHPHFTWEQGVDRILERLAHLRTLPPRPPDQVRVGLPTGAPTIRSEPSLCPPPLSPATPRSQPRVSLCMIVKDEADKLADCLRSAAGLVDEVVVVDTGSTDNTRQVAVSLGARVADSPWVDDFAAARNASLEHARGDWIFWLDADERLDEANRARLRRVFAGLAEERIAYVMRQLSAAGDPHRSAVAVDQVRLFRRDPAVRWQYRVHEQILLSLRRAGHAVRWTDVVIGHAGYQDPAQARRKLERNVRLLLLELRERPDDPIPLYHLGLAYSQQGRTAEALPLLRRSLELAPADYSIRPKLYATLCRGHHRLGQRPEALAACRAGLRQHPDDAELLFLEGQLLREAGDWAGAEAALRRLVEAPPRQQFGSVDAGLAGYRARHSLALVCQSQGRLSEAQTQLSLALRERPDFLPAWLALGELRLRQESWPELEEAVRAMEPLPGGAAQAVLLRARGCLVRREFTEAGRLLEGEIARDPRALAPRVLLAQALVQEGRDRDAAERALREVLALDPTHAEARRLLELLSNQPDRAPAGGEANGTAGP